jgi:hypothetical protein
MSYIACSAEDKEVRESAAYLLSHWLTDWVCCLPRHDEKFHNDDSGALIGLDICNLKSQMLFGFLEFLGLPCEVLTKFKLVASSSGLGFLYCTVENKITEGLREICHYLNSV